MNFSDWESRRIEFDKEFKKTGRMVGSVFSIASLIVVFSAWLMGVVFGFAVACIWSKL